MNINTDDFKNSPVMQFFQISIFQTHITLKDIEMHICMEGPLMCLYRCSSLQRWVMGPHIGFKSSLVIRCPHNGGGVECVHAVKMKVKPAWRTYTVYRQMLSYAQLKYGRLWPVTQWFAVATPEKGQAIRRRRRRPVTHDFGHRRLRKKGAAMKVRQSAAAWVFYSTAGDKEGIYDLP